MSIKVFAMSNMRDDRTGLPGKIFIWISTRSGAKHGPRIKVSKLRGQFAEKVRDTFSVSVSEQPEVVAGEATDFSAYELDSIFQWVILNRRELTVFWNSTTLDYEDIKPNLKKPPPVRQTTLKGVHYEH